MYIHIKCLHHSYIIFAQIIVCTTKPGRIGIIMQAASCFVMHAEEHNTLFTENIKLYMCRLWFIAIRAFISDQILH